MGYAFLETETLPGVLKDKPRWVSCVIVTAAVLVITVSAVAVGTIIGYMYCYMEHRHGITKGNIPSLKQLAEQYLDTEEARYNRTLHGAIKSSLLVSRILKYSHDLLYKESEHQHGQIIPILLTQ